MDYESFSCLFYHPFRVELLVTTKERERVGGWRVQGPRGLGFGNP